MPVYPPKIADAIRRPSFCISVANNNAVGADAKFDCGCFIRVEMRIEQEGLRIREIGYRTNGCGFLIAAAEAVSAKLFETSLLDLHGEIELDPNPRPECSVAVARSVKNALTDHRSRRLEESCGDKVLICTCFGVSEETIEQFAATGHANSVTDVSRAIRAGSACGSCRMLIQEIIDAND